MKEHEKRIRDFLSERSNMRGLCPEQITGANDNHLNVSDLRALLADLDGMRECLEAIELALRIPGMTGLQILDENSPIRDAIRAALKGAEA